MVNSDLFKFYSYFRGVRRENYVLIIIYVYNIFIKIYLQENKLPECGG